MSGTAGRPYDLPASAGDSPRRWPHGPVEGTKLSEVHPSGPASGTSSECIECGAEPAIAGGRGALCRGRSML